MTFWTAAFLVATVYCIVRGVADLRQRKYVWGAAGILSVAILVLMPIPAHVTKWDVEAYPSP